MTSTLKSAINLDVAELVDGELLFPVDVLDPLGEIETHLGTARERVSVSANDTHMKHLDDALVVGSGLTKAIINGSGDEQIQLTAPSVDPAGLVLIDDGVLSTNASSILMSSISSTRDDWLLVAWLRGATAATTLPVIAQVDLDTTIANYYSQDVTVAGSSVTGAERLGASVASLMTGNARVPGASSPSGSWGLLMLHLIGVNSSTYGVTARWGISSGFAESTGNIQWLRGTGWYNQLSVADDLEIKLTSSDILAGSRYKLYGMKGS